MEDVRKLRLTVEHADMLGKVPDVVANLRKYGIIVSVGSSYLRDYPSYLADYGPSSEPFMVTAKSWLDQGVKVVGQVHSYRGIGRHWWLFMTRKVNGKAVGADEALDRVNLLKMWTTWASEYVMKEKDLGTLEAGKMADFVVLDKDILKIPEDEIPKIIPQLTVMSGKIRHLGKEYASELGTQPVGYQFAEGYLPWDEVPEGDAQSSRDARSVM